MTKWLIAADADQIQNFIFRSSHLREVVGASGLLTKFGKDVEERAGADAIVSAGGGFRLAFDSEDEAQEACAVLAESFRQRTGTTLTTAGPTEYEPEQPPVLSSTQASFRRANQSITLALAEAKYQRAGSEAVAHAPLVALCASCGVEVASRHASPTPELDADRADRPMYLCDLCWAKAGQRDADQNLFFSRMRKAVGPDCKLFVPPDPADSIGLLDNTRYVAYLLADANSMGKRFNRCDHETDLQALSKRLDKALWDSLAAPVGPLRERIMDSKWPEWSERWMPLAPLIVGGDDMLALLPARWALDAARRIAKHFEKAMTDAGDDRPATIGMAVVICQAHYPYKLAYEHGQHLLESAKRLGKECGASTLAFDIVLGNEIAEVDADSGYCRATLNPYLLIDGDPTESQQAYGLPLEVLLKQRLDLKDLPGKRRAELRRLFDHERLAANPCESNQQWSNDLDNIVARSRMTTELGAAIQAMGDNGSVWRNVVRPEKRDAITASGLPDLLRVWDYAFLLDHKIGDYEAEEP